MSERKTLPVTWRVFAAVVCGTVILLVLVNCSRAEATTTLCTTNSTPCSSPYPSGTGYSGGLTGGTESTFALGFSTVKCTASSVSFVQQFTASPELGIANLSFSFCNATVNVPSLGAVTVNYTEGMNATTFKAFSSEIEFIAGTTKCLYWGPIGTGLKITGGSPALLTASNIEMTRLGGSSALCANPAKWNASYTLSQSVFPST